MATIRPITDAKGAITHYLAIKEDITERRRAEQELRRSEAHLAEAQKVSHVGSWVWSVAKKEIVYWSDEHYRIFGMEPGKGTAPLRQSQEKIHPEDLPRFHRLINELLAQKKDYEADFRIVLSDGSVRNLRSAGHPVVNESGDLVEFVGTCMDMTERKRAEEELQGSRQMLQSILDAIPQRVFWKDRNSTYLGCNRAFATDAGLEAPSAIIGKNDFDLAWAGTAEAYRADDKLVIETGSAKLNFEERQSRPDGSVLWLQTNKLPLRDRDGKVTGILGTYEDVTKRKETEQTLQRSEEKFRQLAENIHEVFWMMSPTADEILYVSPAYEQVWGRTCESLYRNPMAWIEAIHPDDMERAHALFARQMQGERVESEYRIRTPDGQEKWISDRAFPIRDKDGQIIRVVGIAEETTERKRADKELRLTQVFAGELPRTQCSGLTTSPHRLCQRGG